MNKHSFALHPTRAEIARTKSQFKVVVAGRRFGKCLYSNTMIQMADGSLKAIIDVEVGDWVMTINETTYQQEPRQVLGKECNGVRPTYRVKTSKRSIIGTPNHPLLVDNDWVNIGDIKPKQLLAVAKSAPFGEEDLPDHIIDLLAIWLAEGSGYIISNTDPEILSVFERAMKTLSDELELIRVPKSRCDWKITNVVAKKSPGKVRNQLRLLLQHYGLWGKRSKTKFILDIIFELPKEKIARFLNRFYGCDGCITLKSKTTYAVECGLANEHMVNQLSRLLEKFGIRAQIRHKVHNKTDRHGKPYQSWNLVCCNSAQVCLFCEEINMLSKEDRIDKAYEAIKDFGSSVNEYLPIDYDDFVSKMKPYEPRKMSKYGGYNAKVMRGLPEELRSSLNSWRKQTRTRTTTVRYEQVREAVDGYYDALVYQDVAWEEVISVEPCGEKMTWDLQIDGNHNFIANGIVSHNTFFVKTQLIKYVTRKAKSMVW